jgi:hypothetical protein
VRARDLAVLLALAACSSKHREPPKPRAADVVPRGSATIDGDWEEKDWSHTAWRAQFKSGDGQLARPSSEIRLLHDDRDLLVALYAADENIETRDAFDLAAGPVSLHVDVTGKVTPAVPGVRAKAGFDEGTLDDPRDDDEEWVVELAIPLTLVGAPPLAIKASRCDVPKDNVQRCGGWAGGVRLE